MERISDSGAIGFEDARYVNITGDTMTGKLSIAPSPALIESIDVDSGRFRFFTQDAQTTLVIYDTASTGTQWASIFLSGDREPADVLNYTNYSEWVHDASDFYGYGAESSVFISTGNFAVRNPNGVSAMFLDTTNIRMGFGTASPARDIHIKSNGGNSTYNVIVPQLRLQQIVNQNPVVGFGTGLEFQLQTVTGIDDTITSSYIHSVWTDVTEGAEIADMVFGVATGGVDAVEKMRLASTGNLTTMAGKIINTTRATTTYTILVTDDVIFANTDGAAWTITLPAGVEGQTFRIINSGSTSNDLTIAPDGTEHILGVNSNYTLVDAEVLVLTYNATDGWY